MTVLERPAGFIEATFPNRAIKGGYRTVFIGAEYDRDLTRQQLYPALAKVVQDYPALGVSFVQHPQENGQSKWTLRRLDKIDLDQVVTFEPSLTRDVLANTRTLGDVVPYDSALPTWRVWVIDGGNTVVLVYNHSNMDGMSGTMFHRRLAKYLSEPQSLDNGELIAVIEPSTEPLTPPIEHLMNLSAPLWEWAGSWLSGLYNRLIRGDSKDNSAKAKRLPPLDDGIHCIVEKSKTNTCKFIDLDADTMARVLALTRKHHITVYTLFMAIYTAVLMDVAVPDKYKQPDSEPVLLDLSSAVNARPLESSKDLSDTMGLIAVPSHLMTYFKPADLDTSEKLLALAKTKREELVPIASGANRQPLYQLGALAKSMEKATISATKDLANASKSIPAKSGEAAPNASSESAESASSAPTPSPETAQRAPCGVATSSLGALAVPAIVKSFWFTQALDMGMPLHCFGVVGIVNGPTTIAVTYMGTKDLAPFATRFVELLDKVLAEAS